METSYDYWEKYYATHREPTPCSNFAKFVLPFLKPDHLLLELGCGNGKDSIHFARNGVNVLAVDQCTKEMHFLSEKFAELPNIDFTSGDMTALEGVPNPDYVYSRFTLHAIDLEGEKKVLSWVSKNLNPKGLFLIEVRSVNDELYGQGTPMPDNAYFTDHYRRFEVLDELEQRIKDTGLEVIYKLESKGLAPYNDKDPSIIRIIAMKL